MDRGKMRRARGWNVQSIITDNALVLGADKGQGASYVDYRWEIDPGHTS
jgi:hypothetical protein